MKKRIIFLHFYFLLVSSFLFIVPVTAQYASPVGWSTLPFTDEVDDIFQYTDDDPCKGDRVSLHGEVDVKAFAAIGADLIIQFKSTPVIGNHFYQCTIYIDTDSDEQAEYYIAAGVVSGNLFLKRVNDSTYWTGSDWGISMGYLTVVIIGNNLSIQELDEPLPTFASARYGVVWGYIGESPTVYSDYAPNNPNCPVKINFPWILVVIGISCLSLAIVYKYRTRILNREKSITSIESPIYSPPSNFGADISSFDYFCINCGLLIRKGNHCRSCQS